MVVTVYNGLKSINFIAVPSMKHFRIRIYDMRTTAVIVTETILR